MIEVLFFMDMEFPQRRVIQVHVALTIFVVTTHNATQSCTSNTNQTSKYLITAIKGLSTDFPS